ncbi:MAG: hypothetical protein WBA74_00895 [Cyclobacteriaceae bacterium]
MIRFGSDRENPEEALKTGDTAGKTQVALRTGNIRMDVNPSF